MPGYIFSATSVKTSKPMYFGVMRDKLAGEEKKSQQVFKSVLTNWVRLS
jgi:hypothetical protein